MLPKSRPIDNDRDSSTFPKYSDRVTTSAYLLTRFIPLPYRLPAGRCVHNRQQKSRFRPPAAGSPLLPILQLFRMEHQTVQSYDAISRRTILLVEDFDATRLIMKLWLLKIGYCVLEAETGEEAIIIAQRELPDLIIMDMMMPGMNGLDATQRIREYQPLSLTPIVAVSAYGAGEYRSIAIEAGCNEYVSTPFEPSALAEIIRDLLAGKEPSRNNVLPRHLEH